MKATEKGFKRNNRWDDTMSRWEMETEMLLLYARARFYEAKQKLREAIAREEHLTSLLRRERTSV